MVLKPLGAEGDVVVAFLSGRRLSCHPNLFAFHLLFCINTGLHPGAPFPESAFGKHFPSPAPPPFHLSLDFAHV